MESPSENANSDDSISDSKLDVDFADAETLLAEILPKDLRRFCLDRKLELQNKFASLTDGERNQILTLLREDPRRVRSALCSLRSVILCPFYGKSAVDIFFNRLRRAPDRCRPFNTDDSASLIEATSPLLICPGPSNFVDSCRLLWKVLPQRFIALSREELLKLEFKFNSSSYSMRHGIPTSVDRCSPESIRYSRGILDTRAGPTAVDAILHAPLETAAVPALTNFESGNFWGGPSDGPSYASSIQIDFQKRTASMNMGARETIFREESLAPISSPRISLYGGNMVTSHHNLKAGSGHHSQRAPPDQQNSHLPDAASTGYTSQDHDSLCIDMSNIDNTGTRSHSGIAASHGNSPIHQGEFIDTSNSLASYAAYGQSHSQRSADGIGLTSDNVELPSGNGRISSEGRATTDEETARYLKFFKTVAPPILLAAYSALTILKSTNKAQPASTKALTCITLGSTCVAVCTSLAGASLSFFNPNTLPFGCNPGRILQIMQNVTLHSTVYAFIGTLCLRFLQDHQLEMWMAFGLPSAIFMAVMIWIGWRR